jgi:hypothetical protein
MLNPVIHKTYDSAWKNVENFDAGIVPNFPKIWKFNNWSTEMAFILYMNLRTSPFFKIFHTQ